MRLFRVVLVVAALIAFSPGVSAAKVVPPVPPVAWECTATRAPLPTIDLDPTLHASGEAITAVQALVGVDTDGIYGPVTAAAVAALGPTTPVTICQPDYRLDSPLRDALTTLAAQAPDLTAAAQARIAQTRQPVTASPGPAGGTVGDCTGFAIPDYIIQRESGGNPSAYNPSGAYGCAQTLLSHYSSGSCQGLDPYTIDGQRSCVDVLSNGGTNLQPWAATR